MSLKDVNTSSPLRNDLKDFLEATHWEIILKDSLQAAHWEMILKDSPAHWEINVGWLVSSKSEFMGKVASPDGCFEYEQELQ